MNAASTCRQPVLKECGFYRHFEELPHRRGYGVKILRDKRAIKGPFKKCRLDQVAFRSTNGVLNLHTSLIEGIAIQGGYYDK